MCYEVFFYLVFILFVVYAGMHCDIDFNVNLNVRKVKHFVLLFYTQFCDKRLVFGSMTVSEFFLLHVFMFLISVRKDGEVYCRDAGLGVKVDNIMTNLMIVMGYQATHWLYIVEHENFLYPSYSNQRPTTNILSSCFLLGLQTTMIDYAREGPPQNRSSGSSSSSSASLTAASAFSFLLLGTQMYLILPC